MNRLMSAIIAFVIGIAVGFIISQLIIGTDEACINMSLSQAGIAGTTSPAQVWQELEEKYDVQVTCLDKNCHEVTICTVPPPN